MEEILEILERNSKYSVDEIAAMTGKSEQEVREAIKKYEQENTIVGYTTLINWENTDKEKL
jgi:DNA-binding Lrp family transcriptional regulator